MKELKWLNIRVDWVFALVELAAYMWTGQCQKILSSKKFLIKCKALCLLSWIPYFLKRKNPHFQLALESTNYGTFCDYQTKSTIREHLKNFLDFVGSADWGRFWWMILNETFGEYGD